MALLAVARQATLLAEGSEAWLGTDEQARAQAMMPAARASFVAGRILLRRLLAKASGIAAPRWEISAGAGSPPLARLRPAGDAGPAISVSHRLDWVAAAALEGGGGAIGVDIECRRAPRTAAADRAALMLCADELASWHRLPVHEREAALLRAWVAKEAWFKSVPAGGAAWDFRRLAARPSAAGDANVRVWQAGDLFVALACADAPALARFECEGLPADDPVVRSTWRVGPAA